MKLNYTPKVEVKSNADKAVTGVGKQAIVNGAIATSLPRNNAVMPTAQNVRGFGKTQ